MPSNTFNNDVNNNKNAFNPEYFFKYSFVL